MAPGPDGNLQEVFLRQGSLDGACGPYCLLTALLICGVIRREDLHDQLWRARGNTTVGKILRKIGKHSGLLIDGTHLGDLEEILRGMFRRKLVVEPFDGVGTDARSFVVEHVTQGHPVVLLLNQSDRNCWPAHWVVGVGMEQTAPWEESPGIDRLLILDPAGDEPRLTAWNGIIEMIGSGGIYPYRWWSGAGNDEERVGLGSAISLWSR